MNYFGFLKTRIGRRFLTLFLAVSLVPLVTMRWLAIQKSEEAIERQTLAVLRTASDGAEAQVLEFLHDLKNEILSACRDETVLKILHARMATEPVPLEASKFPHLVHSIRQRRPELVELMILDSSGIVVASANQKSVGLNFATAPFFQRGVDAFFRGDVFRNPENSQPAWIMAAPVRNILGHLAGVVAFRLDPRTLSAMTTGRRILNLGADTQSFRIGDTGETYIVNSAGLMITESRHVSNAVLRLKVDTYPVKVGLERGQEVAAEYRDYRGTQVSGASIVLTDPQWIMITEIDFAQAFAPIVGLRHQLIASTLVLILLSIICSASWTRHLIRPINLLRESDRALADREQSGAIVPEEGLPSDEIGELVRKRNARVRQVLEYQEKLEGRTLELQEMVGELKHISYAMVHDMRAPLRAMQGFANLLEEDDLQQSPEERKIYLRKISAAAVRLDRLITDVLTYNRTLLRSSELHPVALEPLLRALIDTCPNLTAHKADIEIEGPLPLIMGNEALLTQCFSHLLDNAIKFVAAGTQPQVRIGSEIVSGALDGNIQGDSVSPILISNGDDGRNQPAPPPSRVRIWIEDNGVGIPPKAHGKVFRIFQRLTDDDKGTGVGLAIVHKVVERMGGSVGIDSRSGPGSRFWVEFQGYAKSPTPVFPIRHP